MAKSAEAFRTIREVADWLGVPTHVLRFWESKFAEVDPVKGPGGRRYYRPDDIRLLGGIRVLLHDQGMTIRGVQKKLSEDGVSGIETLSPEPSFDDTNTSRKPRRTSPRREVKADGNAGGTGQGGLYDLDALADGHAAAPPALEAETAANVSAAPEAPMVHVDTPATDPVEAEVVSFSNALEEEIHVEDSADAPPADLFSSSRPTAPPPPEPIAEQTPAPEAEPIPATPPSAPPPAPDAVPEHALARKLAPLARAARASGYGFSVPNRARLGIVTRRLRTLSTRLDQELQG